MKSVPVILAVLVACGGKSKPAQLAPLPPEAKAAEPQPEAKLPEPAPEPTPPAGPLEVTVPAQQVTVKLVAKGKGKLAPVRYTTKVGGKQQVELAMDFASTEAVGDKKDETIIPTILLTGDAETKLVDKDGKVEYALTINHLDARTVQGSEIPIDVIKQRFASLAGLVIGGSVGANGAAGEIALRVAKPDEFTGGALEVIRLTLPRWPVLPAEPIGVGAKWQATTITTIADKVTVTQLTDYELVAKTGSTWTIKGKTTVSGADQELHGGKISKISGSGASEATLAEGALYPTCTTSLDTQFVASEQNESMALAIKVGGAITAK